MRDSLEAAGGIVEQIVVYQSTDVAAPTTEILEQLKHSEIDWVTVTSSAIAKALHRLYGNHLNDTKLASISPVTSGVMRELGLEPTVEAQTYTMEGLIQAMVDVSDE